MVPSAGEVAARWMHCVFWLTVSDSFLQRDEILLFRRGGDAGPNRLSLRVGCASGGATTSATRPGKRGFLRTDQITTSIWCQCVGSGTP